MLNIYCFISQSQLFCGIMRDFQTWLITQVTAARGAACQFPSELPVCPGCSVYNSQAELCFMTKRCFVNKSQQQMTNNYETVSRPVLEYASTVWSPWLKTDIELLERTQDRARRLGSTHNVYETLEESSADGNVHISEQSLQKLARAFLQEEWREDTLRNFSNNGLG